MIREETYCDVHNGVLSAAFADYRVRPAEA